MGSVLKKLFASKNSYHILFCKGTNVLVCVFSDGLERDLFVDLFLAQKQEILWCIFSLENKQEKHSFNAGTPQNRQKTEQRGHWKCPGSFNGSVILLSSCSVLDGKIGVV